MVGGIYSDLSAEFVHCIWEYCSHFYLQIPPLYAYFNLPLMDGT